MNWPKRHKSILSGFTLVEILVVMALLAIMSVFVIVILNPAGRIWRAQASEAVTELKELAKALELYAIDNGGYPVDEIEGLPAGLGTYISFEPSWPAGPFPGSYYDFDNWTDGRSCVNPAGETSVQITLRNIPNRNPDGTSVWAWYVPLQGSGVPACENVAESDKGECITCAGFSI